MSDTFNHEFDAHEQHMNNEMFAAGQEPQDDNETLNIVNVEHETDKAYLVELKSGYKPWIPKSQASIHDNGLMVSIPLWLQDKIQKDNKDFVKDKHKKPKAFCKFCNATKVEWTETDKGWRLFNIPKGDQHMCEDNIPEGII